MNTMPNTQGMNTCNVMDISNRNSNYKNRCVKLRKEIREPCQPIKSKDDIEYIKNYLINKKQRYNTIQLRDYTLFVIGINLSRRIGDLLSITVGDILNKNGTFKNEFYIISQKKQKQECIILSQNTKDILSMYFTTNPELIQDMNNHLFPSRQSENKSMSYSTAYYIMKNIEKEINKTKIDINDNLKLSTHSLRKTRAFWYIKNHKNDEYAILKVSKALGHSDTKTTMAYLGLDKKELEDYYNEEI